MTIPVSDEKNSRRRRNPLRHMQAWFSASRRRNMSQSIRILGS